MRGTNGVGLADFRPILRGTWRDLSLHVEGDAVGVDTPRNLYEAWVAWEPARWVRFAAGQFRVALGSEFATHEADLPLVGYGFPAYVDGRYDAGARAEGDVGEWAWWQLAGVAGHGFDLEGHRRTSAQGSLRVSVAPFVCLRDDGWTDRLRGLRGGIGYAHRFDGDDPVIVANPLEQRVFAMRDVDGEEGRHVHCELGWSRGPAMLAFERTVGGFEDVPVAAGTNEMDEVNAFSVYGAWNLTGESWEWERGGWVSRDAARDGWLGRALPSGKWTLGARYSNADVDRDLIDAGLAVPLASSQETRSFSLGVFWEPCDTVRVGVQWVRTIADGALATFDDGATGRRFAEDFSAKRDSSFVLRVEVDL